RRRQKAREKGQVLRSRDLISALTVLAAIFVLAWSPEEWIGRWRSYFAGALQTASLNDWSSSVAILQWTSLATARWIAPILAVAFGVAVCSTLAQGGLVIAGNALTPDWSRLNPARNVQQLFSPAGVSRILRSLVPSGVILYLALRIIVSNAPAVLYSGR